MKGERKARSLLEQKRQPTTAYIQDVGLCHAFCSHVTGHAFCSHVTGPLQCFHCNGIYLLFFKQVENTRNLGKNHRSRKLFYIVIVTEI